VIGFREDKYLRVAEDRQMSGKKTPWKPAYDALYRMDWRFHDTLPKAKVSYHGFVLTDPDGQKQNVQFQGRIRNASGNQFFFGIHYKDFSNLDWVVLFSDPEDAMLVLPVGLLKSIFSENPRPRIEGKRWHVSVYFDRYGKSEFCPTNGRCHDVSEFKYSLSAPRHSGREEPETLPDLLPSTYKSKIESAAKYRPAGGETDCHKALKKYVAEHPSVIGPSVGTGPGQLEHDLPSGDIIDVFFSHASVRTAVEVKSRISPEDDITRGLFQCVKYRAVLSACIAAEDGNDSADAVLVLEGDFPENLKIIRDRLNVKVIDNIHVPEHDPSK
jgi:hypothetical protein